MKIIAASLSAAMSCLVFGWGVGKPAAEAPGDHILQVSAHLGEVSNQRCALVFSVTNVGPRELVIGSASLPFSERNPCLTLGLVEQDGLLKVPVRPTPVVKDGNDEVYFLSPGCGRTKSLNLLSGYWEELIPALRRSPVTVLWEYKPDLPDWPKIKPMVGALTIPRQGTNYCPDWVQRSVRYSP